MKRKALKSLIFLASVAIITGCGGTSGGGEEEDVYESSIIVPINNNPIIDPKDEAVDDEVHLNGININDGENFHLGVPAEALPAGAFGPTVCEQWTPYRYYHADGTGGCSSINGQIEGKFCHLRVINVHKEPFKDNGLSLSIALKYGTFDVTLDDKQYYELYTNEKNMAELFISPNDSTSASYFDFVVTCETKIKL
jgi:hypothetical protein